MVTSKYPTFKQVIDAFEKNDQYKYYLVTSSEDVPEGSELYKKNIDEQMNAVKSRQRLNSGAKKIDFIKIKLYYYGRNGSKRE